MARRYLTVLAALALAFLSFASCDDLEETGLTKNSKMRDCDFGYMAEQSKLQEIMGIDPHVFVPFTPEEDFDRLVQLGYISADDFHRNRSEFREDEYYFYFQTVPTEAKLNKVEVVSSDPSVLEILSQSVDGVRVKYHKLGDVDLTVTMEGKGNTITRVYPLRVIGSVEVKFTITPFWLKRVATRVRMNTRKMPENIKDMLIWTKDSVDVVGYCEWYDFKKFGRNVQVTRDTVRYATEEFMARYKKHVHYLIRDVTDAVKGYSKRSISGTYISATDFNGVVTKDTLPHEYNFVPEQVIVYWLPVCDNEFIEFSAYVKSRKSFKHYDENGNEIEPETEEWGDDPDDPGDKDFEFFEEEDDGENDKETVTYFKVVMGDFSNQHEKDSLMNELDRFKKESGFNYELSDEDKDKAIDKINENLGSDEQIEKARRRRIKVGRVK